MNGWEGTIDAGPHRFKPMVAATSSLGLDAIPVYKSLPMMRLLADHIAAEKPARIVELGIHLGGSTAMLAALAPAARILAIELKPGPAPLLSRFERDGGDLSGVRAVYGVDQADSERLRALVAETFDGEPIDLVIDDASHELRASRASLDALLPLVRSGGCYLLEDWSWAHLRAGLHAPQIAEQQWPQGPSLTNLVFELVMATAADGLITRVDLDFSIARAWRGPAAIRREGFRLRDHLHGVEPYPD
ncbi:MAG: class I SAM-dependent methyltransferase [Halioglobus sp.]